MNAVDTNVYVYALDADEPVKQAKALELFDRLVPQSAAILAAFGLAAMGFGGILALAGITRPRPIRRRAA